jgi:integrase
MRITKTVVDRLAANSFVWDSGLIGFGVRRQLRSAFYLIRYRVGGKQRYFTIGRHGELAPDQARKEAQRLLGQIASGKPLEKVETDSFGDAVESYLAFARSRLRSRTLVEIERHLRKYSAPLHLRLDTISRKDVAGVLTGYEGSTRNRVRASLSSMFSWAVKEGLAELNPVTQTWKLAEPARERVLSPDELRRVWLALPSDDYGTIVKLLLLTGQRRDEIGGLQWNEINLTDALIGFPGARTKNHREHTLPLPAQALALFPSKGEGKLFAFNNWHKAKTRLDLKAGVNGWRLHDLRRTCATGMAELGVQPHIIEAVLNHVSGHKAGVAGIYNRASYATAMRSALQRWADHIDKITGPA